MSTESAKPSHKYQVVRDQIAQVILSGEWARGSQMPSEHSLAAQYGVSYMTVRRAVEELIERDLLEREGRNRTIVRHFREPKDQHGTLNLIWAPFGNETLRALYQLCHNEAIARGYAPRLICWSSGSKRATLSAAADEHPTLVGLGYNELQGALLTAMKKGAGRLVLLGNSLEGEGISSVKADDAQVMQMAVARLRALGHRNIGLISHHAPDPIDRVRRKAWQESLAPDVTPDERARWLLHTAVAIGDPLIGATYGCVRAFLESGHADVTALLCSADQSGLGALTACQDCGWNVPDKISILTFGNSPLLPFLRPALSLIDVDLEHHVALAYEMLDAAPLVPARRELVQPRFIEAQSIATAPA